MAQPIYTAHATVTGGRAEGHGVSSDGASRTSMARLSALRDPCFLRVTPVVCVTRWPEKPVRGRCSQPYVGPSRQTSCTISISASSPSGFFAAGLALRISSSSGSETTVSASMKRKSSR